MGRRDILLLMPSITGRTIVVLALAAAGAGCQTERIIDRTVELDRCPVHGASLTVQDVELFSGLVEPEYLEAKREEFPYTDRLWSGSCMGWTAQRTIASVCAACVRVDRQRREQPNS